MTYTIEATGENDSGTCTCCGEQHLSVWGNLRQDGIVVAVYFVYWTAAHPDHGVFFDFIVGEWGYDDAAKTRRAVSLEYRVVDGGPQFMVIDAQNRPVGQNDLAGHIMRRDEVIGTALARSVFDMVDVVWLLDERIVALR
jgi:hypothetical protein